MAGILTHTNNKTYPAKYAELRNEIKNGDLILYHGSSFLSKSIQYFDKAYYNHIGVVWKLDDADRLLTLDMWSEGLTCLPLSRRMQGYKDFCILRPKCSEEKINAAINILLKDWDGRDISYDNLLLLRIAIIKKTGIDITGLSKDNKYICSEFGRLYTSYLFDTYKNIDIITPQDFIRFIDENFEIIADTRLIS